MISLGGITVFMIAGDDAVGVITHLGAVKAHVSVNYFAKTTVIVAKDEDANDIKVVLERV